jgi:2-polyprenyl-6-methoxyphenol hydroxylase-like FAD-dependent oxidoreductase
MEENSKNNKNIIPLNILICGGGIAGPALAFWLAQSGHQVTIIEHHQSLRAFGAQVDLRGQGIEAVKRMGLLDKVKSKLVDEIGVSFVNTQGRVLATIMANTSGQGTQSLTSEYEIMRGDMVQILYDATKDNVKYFFGKTIEKFEQDEKQVLVTFSDGNSYTFDILVGADGQGSYTREAIMPANSPDPYLQLGIHIAYWFVPRIAIDTNMRNTYIARGGRMIMRRSHNPTDSQVYFFLRENSFEASTIHKTPVVHQKQFWKEKFKNAGWQAKRFIEGMNEAEYFYSQEVVQVKMDTWHNGRVVLIGDAAHCASPFSGMGVSGSLVGAYVLAGEINKSNDNLPLAFENYEKAMLPFVTEIQKIKPFLLRLSMPKSQLAINIFYGITRLVLFLRIPKLIANFSKDDRDGGWLLPEYSNQ